MNFQVIFSDDLKKNLSNLKRKDKIMYNVIKKKIMQISSSDKNSIQHFKNLKSPMSDFKKSSYGQFCTDF